MSDDPMMGRRVARGELSLEGRTALVTGAGRNIGRAVVREFARYGANVVINARSNVAEAESVAQEAEQYGVETLIVMGDASDRAVVDAMATRAAEQFGRVDIYVSNAARRLSKTFDETTDEDWHRHLNMQLTASWYLAKAFVDGMRQAGWGRIIHIGGPDGWHGGIYRLPHSAAKGGLHTFTKGLGRELGPYGITVNDVIPGFTETIRDPTTHPHITPEFTRNTVAIEVPIGRQVTVDEVAWACLLLCSERSAGMTATSIHVDGGQNHLS